MTQPSDKQHKGECTSACSHFDIELPPDSIHMPKSPSPSPSQGLQKAASTPSPTQQDRWFDWAAQDLSRIVKDVETGDKEAQLFHVQNMMNNIGVIIQREVEAGKRDARESHITTLEALCSMWEQYCPPPWTHMFMSAGESAEEVLEHHGLLSATGSINWERLEELRKLSALTKPNQDKAA